MKLSELFWESKFERNQSSLFVIATKSEIDPTKVELLSVHPVPFLTHE